MHILYRVHRASVQRERIEQAQNIVGGDGRDTARYGDDFIYICDCWSGDLKCGCGVEVVHFVFGVDVFWRGFLRL